MDDHDRPLNDRGKRDAPHVGNVLHQRSLVPEIIIASTAKRARKTAKLVAANCGFSHELLLTRNLYLAGPQAYVEQLRGVADNVGRAMVVGHNPGLEQLVHALTGQTETLPTAALAVVQLPIESWSDLTGGQQGVLEDLWRPKDEP